MLSGFQGSLPAWGVSLHPSTPQSLPALQPVSPSLFREHGGSFKAVPANGLQFLSLEEHSELLSPCCDQIPDKGYLGEEGWDLGSQPWQESEAAGCPATVRKWKDKWDTLFSFSFSPL